MRLADTNILIYAADTSLEERQKRARAAEILKTEDLCLSVQVLQEFYHQATRPTGRLGMSHEQALDFLDPFMDLTIQPVTQEVFREAAEIANRHNISTKSTVFWRSITASLRRSWISSSTTTSSTAWGGSGRADG